MAATSGAAVPISVVQLLAVNGSQAPMRRIAEKLTQTFKQGVPVQVDAASGFLQECATINNAATAVIAGMSSEAGSNLTSSGVAKTLTQGTPFNQASAAIIPLGAKLNDGTCGLFQALDSVVFQGVVGNSNDGTIATIAATDLGAIFGLTKDAGNGQWYVDKNITTVAGGACVVVVELVDAVGTLNGKVNFKVLTAAQQLG